MDTLGNIFLHLALVACAYAILSSLLGGLTKRRPLVLSARNSVWAVSILVAMTSGLLVACLLKGQFHLEYVYQYTNSTMPTFYKVAALWGGQAGSLLFWTLILCVYSSVAMFVYREKNQQFLPYIITTLMVVAAFFLTILVFAANPFKTMPFSPGDGRGLNPLLQNYYMIIHPPSLYLGYVGMTVPFAFAIAALISGVLDNQWIMQIRRWTITAWFFLSIGNLLGASWAYEVLGWGGYWAWDPVENAAFMPWLTATAFLHSVIIQEKRGMLKTWNMVLVVLSFLLTMTGTFLTRSGIISSVHSFAQSNIGTYFLSFLVLCITVSGGLILFRLKELRSKNTLDSFVSRESSFLFNNLVLVGGAFAVLWGTLFPVLSEWVRGTKITVGPPFFNSVMIPIGLILLFLTGIGPMVAWRKTTTQQLRRNFMWPVAACMITTAAVVLFGIRDFYVTVSFSLCSFVMATIVMEYQQGIAVRRKTLGEDLVTAFLRLVATNRRRYGGYIVHVGIVLLFVGFTGSAFKQDKETQLKPGEAHQFGKYQLRYDSLGSTEDSHQQTVFANISVFKDGKPYASMKPARIFYRSKLEGEPPQPNTHVSIKRSLAEDLYLALLSFDPDPSVQTIFLKVVINPLIQFIWIGGLFLILGTVIVMWPSIPAVVTQRAAKAAMIALACLPLLAATVSTPSHAFTEDEISNQEEAISKKLVCQCGCKFPDLASCSCDEWAIPAKAEIKARLKRGEDEATILKYFVGRDGEKVLATPVPKGFNKAAWIMPALALVLGSGLVILVARKWSHKKLQPVEETAQAAPADDRFRKMIDEELYGSKEG